MAAASITLEAAAGICDLPIATLTAAARDGRLRARPVDGAWLTTPDDLDDFVRAHATDLPRPDEPPPDEMDAEGPDGQVYGG